MSSASPTAAPPKLLLVDDLPANLLALEAILEDQGYELIQVTSGSAALAAVEQHELAAILLDVNMPIMDGFETARRIKALPRGSEVPIIFVTAVPHDAQRIRDAYTTGAVDFIPKPLDRDILRAKVRVFADMHRARGKHRAEADRLAEDLQTAGKLNEEFLASLGRELRTPLHTIIGWVRALRSGTVQEPQRGHALDAVERHADAQLELIGEMLDMNNLAAGTLTLNRSTVDLAKLVEGIVGELRPEAAAASVTIDLSIDPEVRPLSGDPERLAQVARQLIKHGLRVSSLGGKVAVMLRRLAAQVQLTVEHAGSGIDPDKIAILQRLVELHGGMLQTETDRFVVRLPSS